MEKELTINEPENYKKTKDRLTAALKNASEKIQYLSIPEINIYDMLFFEDESGSIYQDCACSIRERFSDFEIKCNSFYVYMTKDFSRVINITGHNTFDKESGCYIGYRDDFKLKEIWTRTDEDTYKKVWENK